MDATLPKAERLCGKTAVVSLFESGKNASEVKRNLLKRRIREAYRRQKALLGPGVDVLFIYTSTEVLPYEVIFADMTTLLTHVGDASRH